MNILAVDATGQALTLAVRAGEKTFALRRSGRAHDELLHRSVEALLEKAGLEVKDLSAVAAASGPGRFTGIRIGMAYAAVAGLTLKIPALAVSRLEALAALSKAPRVCAALPGWRKETYYQAFRRSGGRLKPEGEPAWCDERAWPAVKAGLAGVEVLEGDVSARELLAPAAWQLESARRPDFAPLYLKPAGYEARK